MVDEVSGKTGRYFPHPAVQRFTSGVYPDHHALVTASQDTLKENYPRYSRFGTPVTDAVEQEVTRLEGGYGSLCVCSGLAAITSTLLAFLRPGDHILVNRSVYEPVRHFINTYLSQRGVSATFLSSSEFMECDKFLNKSTTLIYIESPSSNVFEVTDIEFVVNQAQKNNILVVMDNTWSTPLLMNPIKHGVDVVIHSASKYLSGHSDAVAGIITTTEKYFSPLRKYLMMAGICLGGEESFSIYKGLKTLGVRLDTQANSASKIIELLSYHPHVGTVLAPQLITHPDHCTYNKYYKKYNGVFSFSVACVSDKKRDEFLAGFKIFKLAYGWGGVDSCIIPFTLTHFLISDPTQIFFRVSTGLEECDLLIADFKNALSFL